MLLRFSFLRVAVAKESSRNLLCFLKDSNEILGERGIYSRSVTRNCTFICIIKGAVKYEPEMLRNLPQNSFTYKKLSLF